MDDTAPHKDHAFSDDTLELLAYLLQEEEGDELAQTQPIPHLSQADSIALSPAQQRLWLLDQLDPGNVAYNVPVAFHLVGSLDRSALRQSLCQIVQRHQILRTTIAVEDGRPVQMVAPADTADGLLLPVIDCQPDQIPVRMHAEFRRPFDLSQGPLLRAALLRLGEIEHLLLLTIHHLVFDGWSQILLYRELTTLYRALATGKPPPLTELPIQYADFAVWQRQQLQHDTATAQLTYWQKQLEDAPTVLSLPTDQPRPATQSFAGASIPLRLSPTLTKALKVLSHQENATLFMTLLAAFTVLLYRMTGQSDIVIGSPVANRNHPQTENLIGFFVNTLPLRTQLSPQWGFRQLLNHVRQTSLAAYAHQDLPFEKLVEAVQPERQLNHTPLFQVMFVFNAAAPVAAVAAGLRFEPLDAGNDTAKFDLTLRLTDGGSALSGVLEYNVDLFVAAAIGRMSDHFTRLLQGIVAQPDRPLAHLPLLSEQEDQQLLVAWQATKRRYPAMCIHQLFEAQVKRTPEATAVCFQKETLSYRSLNNRANQLAHHLKNRDIGPGATVGLYLERSFDLAVSLLAVWKAGAAYVPLDVDLPRVRLAHMLRQTQPALILTQEPLLARLPPPAGQTICLDRDRHLLASEVETDPPPTATPDDLAYVVYTSGSTGPPKGILTRHSSVVNYLTFLTRTYAIDGNTTVLQLPAISFDASVRDMIGPLTAGGRVVLVSNAEAKDPAALVAKMRQHRVNALLSVVPTMLRALIETIRIQEDAVETVKLILASGERLFWHDCRQARLAFGPSVQLVNQYGPSECTMTSSYYCVSEIPDSQDGVPVGRPIDNAQIYILDDHLNPVPIGIPGEIHIGGAGLAQGYLQNRKLTTTAFIPHPFSPTPGDRLYKTGDLGRFSTDGTITFLGRHDRQVKIAGIRVEPGEIEAVLSQHPAVRETAVIAVEGQQPGQKSLVAYIVPRQTPAPSPPVLRRFLRQELPATMIPTTIIPLAALPRTPHGKIDRQALSAPDQAPSRQRFIGPRTPAEQIVTDTWTKVLGVSPISVDDNFFELGGHSLLAAQLIHRLNQRFQIVLPLRTVFETPTVIGVTEAVARQQRAQTLPQVAWRQCSGRVEGQNRIYPLSFGQQRLWFLDQLFPDNAAYNTHFAARLRDQPDVAALAQSLQQLVRRHQILRTTFALREGEPVQVVAPSSEFQLQVEDLRSLPAAERRTHAQRRLAEEITRPFALERGPLLRAKLLHLEDETLFCLVMHHIITDGWSYQVLLKELATLYDHMVRGETPPLKALPLQYGNFAAWQRHQWQAGDHGALLTYWKQQLSGAPARLALPTDWPRPPQQTFHGAEETLVLSQNLSQKLKALSFQQGVTLFMLLLTAFKVLLYRLSGQSDVLVGTPIAGRTQVDLESLIGFFVNTLVLRTQVTDKQSFKEVMQRVRQTFLAAYEHQALPFEKLVEALQPQRDLATTPLFQVTFVFQNAPEADLTLAGTKITPLVLQRKAARVDLALYGQETGPRLSFNLVYNSDLFAAKSIRRWLRHFETLLGGIVANPDRPVCDLLLPPAQTQPRRVATALEERAQQSTYVPPRDPWELQLVQLWEALLHIRPIGVTTSFFDLGGHSLLAIRLLHQIEQQFQQSLPLMQLFQEATIEEIATHLRQQTGPARSSPLLPFRTSGRKRPFFCVHPIGGHALCYLDLASHLDPEQPFYGLQAIGLYDEQDPISRLEQMAARYLDEMRHIQAQGPYQLGGWSFGGLVALEMARQLQAQGQRVALLALLDTRPAVSQRRRGPDRDNGETIRRLRTAVQARLGHDLPLSDGDLRWLGAHDWRMIREQAESVTSAQVRRLLRVYAANYRALSRYRPKLYPGPISLFLAQEHTRQASQTIIKGWQDLSVDVNVYTIPGTHQTIVSQPHVRFLARSLQERLNDVH